jgi:hypothetical protein
MELVSPPDDTAQQDPHLDDPILTHDDHCTTLDEPPGHPDSIAIPVNLDEPILITEVPTADPLPNFTPAHPEIEALIVAKKKLESDLSDSLTKLERSVEPYLSELNAQYKSAAAILDSKYQQLETIQKFAKPSRQLLELRVVAQRLLRQNRTEEAEKYFIHMNHLEEIETANCSAHLQHSYVQENDALKLQFVKRRREAFTRMKIAMQEEERKFGAKIKLLERRIAILRGQLNGNVSDHLTIRKARSVA